MKKQVPAPLLVGLALLLSTGLIAAVFLVTYVAYEPAATTDIESGQAPDLSLNKGKATVLIFYNPEPTCPECDLHVWRLAYYNSQFKSSGADVIGIVGGLRDGQPHLEAETPLPWQLVLDLSGKLADYYGVSYEDNPNPTVLVLAADGTVIQRVKPSDMHDRFEADTLTTLLAIQQGISSPAAERVAVEQNMPDLSPAAVAPRVFHP